MKKLVFKREDAKDQRIVVGGVAVITSAHIVTPSSITREQLEQHVSRAAKHDGDEWIVPFGELGDCCWPEREGLLEESANYLYESGVGVQGWPVYELDEDVAA